MSLQHHNSNYWSTDNQVVEARRPNQQREHVRIDYQERKQSNYYTDGSSQVIEARAIKIEKTG
jgi:hypothetical protein